MNVKNETLRNQKQLNPYKKVVAIVKSHLLKFSIVYSNHRMISRKLKFYATRHTVRKLVKVVQYICVVVAEFNLMRYYVKILHRRKATKEELANWFKRWKTIGSALSTTRMCLRLGAGIENIGYFLKQLEAYRKNCTIILF